LEPNAFKKSLEICQIAKSKYLWPKALKFARFLESGDKFTNVATLLPKQMLIQMTLGTTEDANNN